MDEGRRFLRYLSPGLLAIAETLLLIALFDIEFVQGLMSTTVKDNGAATVITLLVLSGGLGSLFAMAHHVLHWSIWIPIGLGISPRTMISTAIERGDLRLRTSTNDDSGHVALSNNHTWQLLVALWHERAETNPRMKGADARATSLGDIMHNAGTALVGGVAALIVSLWVIAERGELSLWFFPLAGLIALMHVRSYALTSRMSQGVVDIILADALSAERRSGAAVAITPAWWNAERRSSGKTVRPDV